MSALVGQVAPPFRMSPNPVAMWRIRRELVSNRVLCLTWEDTDDDDDDDDDDGSRFQAQGQDNVGVEPGGQGSMGISGS